MKFNTKYNTIVYCKNDYREEFDNNMFYKNENINYFKGYLIHREAGPAIIWTKNEKLQWYINGKRHREDGPAIEWSDGEKSWYLNSIIYTEEEYLKIMSLKNKKRVLNEV